MAERLIFLIISIKIYLFLQFRILNNLSVLCQGKVYRSLKLTNTDRDIKAKSLFSYFEAEIKRLKVEERLGYAETYQSALNCLKRFTEGKDYAFVNMQLAFLKKFEAYLLGRNCAVTTRSVYFRTFRTVWRIAISDKICPEKHYPFKDFAFSKYTNPRTKKRAITKAQIDKIVAVQILDYYKNLEGNSDEGYIFPILYKRHATSLSIRDRKKKILKRVDKDIKELAKSVGIEKKCNDIRSQSLLCYRFTCKWHIKRNDRPIIGTRGY